MPLSAEVAGAARCRAAAVFEAELLRAEAKMQMHALRATHKAVLRRAVDLNPLAI